MKRGLFVAGTFIFPDDGTVWRAQLSDIISKVIRSHEGLTDMPVYVSLPHEPWIQSAPRPPVRIVISIMQHEWRPDSPEGYRPLMMCVSEAVLGWLIRSTTSFNEASIPTNLLVELVFEHRTIRHYTSRS